MQEDSTRLFVALWPDPPLQRRLRSERDAWHWPPGARPVADASLHLTLHFLGAFARQRVAVLESALAAQPVTTTTLRASGREIWRGGIAVLLFTTEPALSALHGKLGAALAALDVALDPRPFSPHVTLARRARGAVPPGEPADLAWRARGFALVESGRGGAYRVLRVFGDG
ncbi:MAG TPA: RNA 2',3'-cyclic phosphodiesterase [Caldimonas sp.]|jgi:2'-5' RNA ligase